MGIVLRPLVPCAHYRNSRRFRVGRRCQKSGSEFPLPRMRLSYVRADLQNTPPPSAPESLGLSLSDPAPDTHDRIHFSGSIGNIALPVRSVRTHRQTVPYSGRSRHQGSETGGLHLCHQRGGGFLSFFGVFITFRGSTFPDLRDRTQGSAPMHQEAFLKFFYWFFPNCRSLLSMEFWQRSGKSRHPILFPNSPETD